jgi:BolA protein
MIIQHTIQEKLLEAFSPSQLDVVNESHQHNVPAGSESHFKVIIVTDNFEGKRLIQRHRAVNSILAIELSQHIHALALHTYTETEWRETYADKVPLSPKCMGGSKK